jgi:hypothetical protein
MFQMISDFINAILSFSFTVPLWLQITIIIIVIIALSSASYFASDLFDTTYMRSGMAWFIFVAVLNLSTILVVFIYYSSKMSDIDAKISDAKPGPVGKKGKKGKKGKYLSCSYCAKDLFIQQTHSSDVMCELSTYSNVFTAIDANLDYFQSILDNGNTINYSGFVYSILLGETVSNSNVTTLANFTSLMTSTSISWQLMKVVNDKITKASDLTYGTFRTSNVPEGYYPLGDSVYGGLETFELNSFSVNGDVLHPPDYTKIVTFTSFTANLGAGDSDSTDTYTIWRPNAKTITPKFLANNERVSEAKTKNVATVANPITYVPLGDICRNGTTPPNINETVTISSNCCITIDSFSDLTLVFINFGDITFNDETANLDYSQTNTYLITNKTPNKIQIFSVWRTPMNTFITNCNGNNIGTKSEKQPVNNQIVNQSFLFNMYNNARYAVDTYGNIGDEYKRLASEYLQSIELPNILIAAILCRHYEIELFKEMIYYLNYYQKKQDQYGNNYFPKNIFDINIPGITTLPFSTTNSHSIKDTSTGLDVKSTSAFGYVMNMMKIAINENNAFNDELVRKASVSLSSENPIVYDSTKEMHLPEKLMVIYESVNDTVLSIGNQILNVNNLLDIVNIIFDNGLEARIAINSIGLAEGGSLLNEVQETVLILCKMIMPPTQAAYVISDDCLGTFALDRNRESAIKTLSIAMGKFRDVCDEINTNIKKYKKIEKSYNQFQYSLQYDVGIICSHIDGNWSKLNDMDLEEFTTSRIKEITEKYITYTAEIIMLIRAIQ